MYCIVEFVFVLSFCNLLSSVSRVFCILVPVEPLFIEPNDNLEILGKTLSPAKMSLCSYLRYLGVGLFGRDEISLLRAFPLELSDER